MEFSPKERGWIRCRLRNRTLGPFRSARAVAVPAQSREILSGLEQLTIELKQLEEEMAKLGRHLGLARNNLEQMERRTGHLTETVDRARSSLDATTPVERGAGRDD